MKYYLLFILYFLTCILYLISCKRSTEPLAKNIGKTKPDTTSHNFIWEIDTLPGTIFDISGLDENNVWLVGEFQEIDPLTGETMKYNFGYWNGEKWNLKSVIYRTPFYGIHVFDKRNIWITFGVGIIVHWDGKNWKEYHLRNNGVLSEDDGGLLKIWAVDTNNIYFIGYKGCIVHYNGSSFTKMESGTDIMLTHIFGLDQDHIWVVGDDGGLDGGQSVLLFFNGHNWITKYHRFYEDNTPPQNAYKGIWADQDSLILVNLWGYWHESIKTGKGRQEHISILPAGYPRDFFANNRNDLFMVGDFQTIHHYNGISWNSYIPFNRNSHNTFWTGTFLSKHVVFIGGDRFVYRGYR